MNQTYINLTASNQHLSIQGEPLRLASKTVNFVKAHFELGENWDGFDSVRAVWSTDFNKGVPAVLDSLGDCVVPHEVLTRAGKVRVNLVGSISEDDVLTDRLTTCLVSAIEVCCSVPVDGTEPQTITPNQFEQFVEAVRDDADRAETASTEARESATEASESAVSASQSASASAESATASEQAKDLAQGYAQNAQISAQTAENAKDDAEDARDEILGMRATATTLAEGSEATASYSNGVLTFGIPRGDTGATGAKGDKGDTGATPNLTIGNVETLEPSESATATITGTAENPVLNLGIPQGDTGEVSLADLSTLLPTDTASGSIASFPDGQSVIPVVSLLADIEPIQDLHGYDKPWSGGNGKNKLPSIGATFTDRGVTWTLNDDGSVKLSGTASANSVYDFGRNVVELEAGTYFANETASGYSVIVFSIVGGTASVVKNGGGQFTLTERTSVFMRVLVASGTTPNTTIYPQIEKSASFTSYEPYTNICPISGRTEVVTVVSPTTSAEDGDTYTTDLGRTVYGGTLDVVSGELVVDRAMIDGSNLTFTYWDTDAFYSNAVSGKTAIAGKKPISECYELMNPSANTFQKQRFYVTDASASHDASVINANVQGKKFVYYLAEPQTIQLTPQEVYALLGQNNVWADSGSVEIVYKADVTKWIEKKLNS